MRFPTRLALLGLIGLLASGPKLSGSDAHEHPASHPPEVDRSQVRRMPLVEIPEARLIDQHGRTVELAELVAGKRVAMNFIFTSCTTVCPPMGALFARLQRDLEARGETDVTFLSISIDPAVDTPDRLAAWAEKFGGSDEWRLLTGDKPEIDRLLKKLGVFSALINDHAPLVLLGNQPEGRWLRAYGLAPPADLARALDGLATSPEPTASRSVMPASATSSSQAVRDYFTHTVLIDQDGQEQRFYSDLIAGRTVVINPFFATCTGSCPVMHRALAAVQQALGDRLGRDVFLLSVTVDPAHDTPAKLRGYAEAFGAGPGWRFLTGAPEDVETVLRRLGQHVEQKEAHQAIFLVGNDRTGLWQKAFGLGPAERFLEVVRSVAGDRGEEDEA